MLENKRNSLANYDSFQNESQLGNRFESPIHIKIKNRENYFVLSPAHKILDRMEEINLSKVLSPYDSIQRKGSNCGEVTPSRRITRKMENLSKKYSESTPQSLHQYGQNGTFIIERAFKSPILSLRDSNINDDYESLYHNLRLDYDKILNQLQIRDEELLNSKKEYEIFRYHLLSLKNELASMNGIYNKKVEELLQYTIQNQELLDEIIILKKSNNQGYNSDVEDLKYHMNELSVQLEQKCQEINELKNSLNKMKMNNRYETKEFEATIFILNQEIKHKENEIKIKDIEIKTLTLNQQHENGSHQYRDTINKDLKATPKKHSILYKKVNQPKKMKN